MTWHLSVRRPSVVRFPYFNLPETTGSIDTKLCNCISDKSFSLSTYFMLKFKMAARAVLISHWLKFKILFCDTIYLWSEHARMIYVIERYPLWNYQYLVEFNIPHNTWLYVRKIIILVSIGSWDVTVVTFSSILPF